ncbi:MAG: YcxB family protein [Caulobacter sp.]|nr:YcxB family protein [Caulobacter sp.]
MASISLQYRPQDFLDAWRLQLRHNTFMRVSRFWPLALLALSGLASWTTFRDDGLLAGVLAALPMALLSGLLLGLNVLSDRVLLPRRAKRFVTQQKSIQGDILIAWDGEGLTFKAAKGQSTTAWGDYFKWLENDVVLVAFQSENMLNILPKRSLSPDQVTEIRDYLAAAIGPAGKRRK